MKILSLNLYKLRNEEWFRLFALPGKLSGLRPAKSRITSAWRRLFAFVRLRTQVQITNAAEVRKKLNFDSPLCRMNNHIHNAVTSVG